jgi:hypothetical protein
MTAAISCDEPVGSWEFLTGSNDQISKGGLPVLKREVSGSGTAVRPLSRVKVVVVALSVVTASAIQLLGTASAQTALEGKTLSALAPENLNKPRPKAPFDLTGTWTMVIDAKTGRHKFEPHRLRSGHAGQVGFLDRQGLRVSR